MNKIIKSNMRGFANHGWLNSYHSFSFASFYNPEMMGFSALRVINDDKIAPKRGFGTHGHENMEIITYVLKGELKHQDSMGFSSIIKYGNIQRMSAGTGVKHSEFNNSENEELHLIQIWIQPNIFNIEPSYEEKYFSEESKLNNLKLIASPKGIEDSIHINQDAYLYASILNKDNDLIYNIKESRKIYIHNINGSLDINGNKLEEGDAIQIENEKLITINSLSDSEFLLFDLP